MKDKKAFENFKALKKDLEEEIKLVKSQNKEDGLVISNAYNLILSYIPNNKAIICKNIEDFENDIAYIYRDILKIKAQNHLDVLYNAINNSCDGLKNPPIYGRNEEMNIDDRNPGNSLDKVQISLSEQINAIDELGVKIKDEIAKLSDELKEINTSEQPEYSGVLSTIKDKVDEIYNLVNEDTTIEPPPDYSKFCRFDPDIIKQAMGEVIFDLKDVIISKEEDLESGSDGRDPAEPEEDSSTTITSDNLVAKLNEISTSCSFIVEKLDDIKTLNKQQQELDEILDTKLGPIKTSLESIQSVIQIETDEIEITKGSIDNISGDEKARIDGLKNKAIELNNKIGKDVKAAEDQLKADVEKQTKYLKSEIDQTNTNINEEIIKIKDLEKETITLNNNLNMIYNKLSQDINNVKTNTKRLGNYYSKFRNDYNLLIDKSRYLIKLLNATTKEYDTTLKKVTKKCKNINAILKSHRSIEKENRKDMDNIVLYVNKLEESKPIISLALNTDDLLTFFNLIEKSNNFLFYENNLIKKDFSEEYYNKIKGMNKVNLTVLTTYHDFQFMIHIKKITIKNRNNIPGYCVYKVDIKQGVQFSEKSFSLFLDRVIEKGSLKLELKHKLLIETISKYHSVMSDLTKLKDKNKSFRFEIKVLNNDDLLSEIKKNINTTIKIGFKLLIVKYYPPGLNQINRFYDPNMDNNELINKYLKIIKENNTDIIIIAVAPENKNYSSTMIDLRPGHRSISIMPPDKINTDQQKKCKDCREKGLRWRIENQEIQKKDEAIAIAKECIFCNVDYTFIDIQKLIKKKIIEITGIDKVDFEMCQI